MPNTQNGILKVVKSMKVIKSDQDYNSAIAEIENLMDKVEELSNKDRDKLELLSLLAQNFESQKFGESIPDPIDAIIFRMEQAKLTPRDLIPYLGSRSKVSEVLARKRPLTLSMMRALHKHLGIPANVFLQDHDFLDTEDVGIEWDKFPIVEMIRRGWVKTRFKNARERAEELLREYFTPLSSVTDAYALFRKTENTRTARAMDNYALTAWTARIVIRALENQPWVSYDPRVVNIDFMREIAQLSPKDKGPLLAGEFLKEHGIQLLVEPHLAKTFLDGAAILIKKEYPIIGLTLRYDRIDNFWFCLMHELAHLSQHLNEENPQIYDDLDVDNPISPIEIQADELAGEALIPEESWKKSAASRFRSPEAAEDLATQLGIHPAIVAGRMRHEFKAYRLLNALIGHKQVRILFPDIKWEE
jgi:HTH-type transcriptional regulator/antitoxin HigA